MANQQNNQDLNFIHTKMTESALTYFHRYIQGDHLFYALILFKPIDEFLRKDVIDSLFI